MNRISKNQIHMKQTAGYKFIFVFKLYIRSNFIISLSESLKHCCCSVAQSCPALCNPMDCGMPGFPVLHYLPDFAHAQVHCSNSCPLMSSDHLILCCPLLLLPSIFAASGSFLASKWAYLSGLTFIWLDKENSLNLPSI